MKREKTGIATISAEAWEKLERLEIKFIKEMKEEGLTYRECEYVLDGCKSLLGITLIGNIFDQCN